MFYSCFWCLVCLLMIMHYFYHSHALVLSMLRCLCIFGFPSPFRWKLACTAASDILMLMSLQCPFKKKKNPNIFHFMFVFSVETINFRDTLQALWYRAGLTCELLICMVICTLHLKLFWIVCVLFLIQRSRKESAWTISKAAVLVSGELPTMQSPLFSRS